MRARALFAGMALALAVASPAAAKGAIAEANISGPGLGGGSGSLGGGGGMRIAAPATDRMWESGILDDRKADSVSDLGLTRADLGPQYLVTYRFDFGPGTKNQMIRQELYPYAKGGPVTYTPPGQKQTGEEDLTGIGLQAPIPAGWFQTEQGFFDYLVSKGLPETSPAAAAAEASPGQEPAVGTAPATETAAWEWILVGLAGLAALALVTPPLRRRVMLTVTRVNH
ncbi:MAG TPA: hypothetical protein VGS09_03695 [Actinomycetota bacterium]|nr:hypothetical protein [Actinomycetota bacterium]